MVDEARELDRRYSRTWIGVPHREKDRIIPRKVHHVQQGESKRHLLWSFEEGEPVQTTIANYENQLVLKPVTFGLITVSDMLHYLIKRPYRQFKAGYYGDNITLSSLQRNEATMMGKRNPGYESAGVLNFIFNPRYEEFARGLEKIAAFRSIGFAINKKFGVGVLRGYPNPCVFYKTNNIGMLDDNNELVLTPSCHHLFEEISQYIPSTLGE